MLKSTRNQIGNAKNPFQGEAKKVLCVCSAGLLRSPTLAHLLHRKYGFNTRACGSSQDFALIPISEALVEWADEIVFVNYENYLESQIPGRVQHKVNLLDVEDSFDYGSEEAEEILLSQYHHRS